MSDSVSPSSESKPKPCFSHLPWNVKQRIVDKTDLITRFTTRKVCKELLRHVDRSTFHFKRIFFTLFQTHISLTIDDKYGGRKEVLYEKNPDNGPEDTGFIRRAVKDLAIILKSPRVFVGFLALSAHHEYQECSEPETRNRYNRDQKFLQDTFKEEFDKLNHKLHIETLDEFILDEEEIMFILPYLKPEALTEISLGAYETVARLNRLIETDHWKKAKVVKFTGTESLPIWALGYVQKALYHHGTVSLDELKQLIQMILESSDRPVFIAGINFRYNVQEFDEYVQQFEQRFIDPRDRFVPIPNTELFLHILFNNKRLYLKKLSRQEMQNFSGRPFRI